MLFRSDRSYLVNLDQLEHFDNHKRELYFNNGSVAYASIRKSWELIKILK
ncbi:LytTR family transcriptional regulator DNA-binding domain-containing protein [Xylocopilactobacillus apis]|nr:LytTR family transcriptional regulator DNA-binding domain-containing protein [Xylocopilactobacillus apis]